ncbi:MAG TPA: type IVB secretion system protein IcmV [Coxiellaceae bacterium]|nr:type IVB secretion system protein IcmV [Coxiellaceae bacterium]
MGLRDGLKNSFKDGALSPFNVSRWIGTDNIKASSRTVQDLYKDLYKKELVGSGVKKETFEEAMIRLGLTEADIQKRMALSRKRLVIYALFGVFTVGYMIYLFAIHQFSASFLCLIILLLLLTYCFKEHFQYYQMKRRKLGCSIKEWLRDLFRGNAQ